MIKCGWRAELRLQLCKLFGVEVCALVGEASSIDQMVGLAERRLESSRLIAFICCNPTLKVARSLKLVATAAGIPFRTGQRWVALYEKFGVDRARAGRAAFGHALWPRRPAAMGTRLCTLAPSRCFGSMAGADGSLRSLLARLSRIDVPVIDDWVMAPLSLDLNTSSRKVTTTL